MAIREYAVVAVLDAGINSGGNVSVLMAFALEQSLGRTVNCTLRTARAAERAFQRPSQGVGPTQSA
jgi:hypothetical protein